MTCYILKLKTNSLKLDMTLQIGNILISIQVKFTKFIRYKISTWYEIFMPAVLQPNGDYHRTKSATRLRIRLLFSISDNFFVIICHTMKYQKNPYQILPRSEEHTSELQSR